MRRGCRWLVAAAVQIVVVFQSAKVVEMQLGKVGKKNSKYSIEITNLGFLPLKGHFWRDVKLVETILERLDYRNHTRYSTSVSN